MSHIRIQIKYQSYDNHWCCNTIPGSTCLTKIKNIINLSAIKAYNSNHCPGAEEF